jgi:hypothetical protein
MTIPRRSDIQARIVWLRENVGASDAKTRQAAERTVNDMAKLINDQRAEVDRLAALVHEHEARRAQAQSALAPPAIAPVGPLPIVAPPIVAPPGVTPPSSPPGVNPPGGTPPGGTPPGTAPPGTTPPAVAPSQAPAVTPLNLAQSFRQVVESVQAQARAAPGDAATIQTLNVEVKGLVQVDASGETNLVLPQTGAALDPQTLSTLSISFAAVPRSAAAPTQLQPVPGQPQPVPGQPVAGSGG